MKRIFTAAFVLLALTAMSAVMAGDAGTASDPLASKTYIEGKFHDALLEEGAARAESRLDAVYGAAAAKLTGDGGDGYALAPRPVLIALSAGKTVRLKTGGSLTVLSGALSAAVEKGALINLTTGTELTQLAGAQPRERYFCAEDSAAVFTAVTDARALVDGRYLTDGKLRANHAVFRDINTFDWYYDAVDFGYSNGFYAGTGPGEFSPSLIMTRGMFVTILHNMTGKPVTETVTELFPDVADPSKWYFAAVVWAKANGISAGTGDGSFRQEEPITREEMTFIMRNYIAYRQYDVTLPADASLDRFPDGGAVSAYAREALSWAVSAGIVSGTGEGKLLPQGVATRAEVAQIILNFRTKYA
jgi:hypothetical protein